MVPSATNLPRCHLDKLPQRVDNLSTGEIVFLEVRQHFDHPGVAPFMELADDIGADVRRRREHAEQVGTSASWETTNAANRVHDRHPICP